MKLNRVKWSHCESLDVNKYLKVGEITAIEIKIKFHISLSRNDEVMMMMMEMKLVDISQLTVRWEALDWVNEIRDEFLNF